jgi:hypothetical protein
VLSLKERKVDELKTRSATQHFCKRVNNAPIQAGGSIQTLQFFGAEFAGSKSKYGSVEP